MLKKRGKANHYLRGDNPGFPRWGLTRRPARINLQKNSRARSAGTRKANAMRVKKMKKTLGGGDVCRGKKRTCSRDRWEPGWEGRKKGHTISNSPGNWS